MHDFHTLAHRLTDWYKENQRELPWRSSRDPYKIWISEVMLQQTTVAAVAPFFLRFMNSFPTIKDLARSPLEEVLEAWSGLGYYSRARNLHKAAQILATQESFPKTHRDLIQLPGFGPYTARAVASLAFGERVGVLDGNVIRILSRLFGLRLEWWKNSPKQELQSFSDRLAQEGDPYVVNQAMMELGATVCTPKQPQCFRCPWSRVCRARRTNQVLSLPIQAPKKEKEIWLWKVSFTPKRKNKEFHICLQKNDYAPFLRNQWIFPGEVLRLKTKPKHYLFKHAITHHEIYVQDSESKQKPPQKSIWVKASEVKKHNPSSLLQKALNQYLPSV